MTELPFLTRRGAQKLKSIGSLRRGTCIRSHFWWARTAAAKAIPGRPAFRRRCPAHVSRPCPARTRRHSGSRRRTAATPSISNPPGVRLPMDPPEVTHPPRSQSSGAFEVQHEECVLAGTRAVVGRYPISAFPGAAPPPTVSTCPTPRRFPPRPRRPGAHAFYSRTPTASRTCKLPRRRLAGGGWQQPGLSVGSHGPSANRRRGRR